MRLGRREPALDRLTSDEFDVVVVGGGVMGAGVALELSLRGRRCALVERGDFACGTSSRSTKLVHGGLRYLIRGETEIVREALEERAFLLRCAPTLVRPLRHVVSLAAHDPRSGERALTRLLAAYDELAGPNPGVPAHRRLTADETLAAAPALGDLACDGALEYHEARTDDVRLTLAVVRAAVAHGALAVNHVEATRVARGEVELHDLLGGDRLVVRPRAVVLAVGPWLDRLPLRPARGAHLVIEANGAAETAVAGRHPRDARPVSITPWRDALLVGTTDVPCAAADADDPRVDAADVDYLLEAARALLPDHPLRVRAAWAGVRPLVDGAAGETSELSREDRVAEVEPGVVAVLGGKLTTFRRVAARAADAVAPGASAAYPDLVDVSCADAAGAVDDMAVTLDDAVTRRLCVSACDPAAAEACAPEWADGLAAALGWDDRERDDELASFRRGLDRFRPPVAS